MLPAVNPEGRIVNLLCPIQFGGCGRPMTKVETGNPGVIAFECDNPQCSLMEANFVMANADVCHNCGEVHPAEPEQQGAVQQVRRPDPATCKHPRIGIAFGKTKCLDCGHGIEYDPNGSMGIPK